MLIPWKAKFASSVYEPRVQRVGTNASKYSSQCFTEYNDEMFLAKTLLALDRLIVIWTTSLPHGLKISNFRATVDSLLIAQVVSSDNHQSGGNVWRCLYTPCLELFRKSHDGNRACPYRGCMSNHKLRHECLVKKLAFQPCVSGSIPLQGT